MVGLSDSGAVGIMDLDMANLLLLFYLIALSEDENTFGISEYHQSFYEDGYWSDGAIY